MEAKRGDNAGVVEKRLPEEDRQELQACQRDGAHLGVVRCARKHQPVDLRRHASNLSPSISIGGMLFPAIMDTGPTRVTSSLSH